MESTSQKASNAAKQAAAIRAAMLVENGMKVGLGTGSTVKYLIQALGERCRQGLQISAAATSRGTERLAEEAGIPLLPNEEIVQLDVAIDGADEVDTCKRMIKGGGGALFREKIIAKASREMVVIIDDAKLVSRLGRFPLPVEILPFAFKATEQQIEKLGFSGSWRKKAGDEFYVTDNGNYIYDIAFEGYCEDPEKDDAMLHSIPGVVETGFFLGMAGRIIIGFLDGKIEIRQ